MDLLQCSLLTTTPDFFFYNPSGGRIVDSSTSLTGYSAFDSGSSAAVNSNPPSRTPNFQSNTSYSNVQLNMGPQSSSTVVLVKSSPQINSLPNLAKTNHHSGDAKFVSSNISIARTPSFTVQINGKPLQGGKASLPQQNSTGINMNVNVSRNSSLYGPSDVKYNSPGAPQSGHQHLGGERRNNKQHQQQQRSARPALYTDKKDTSIPHVPVYVVPSIRDKVCRFKSSH